MPIRTFETNLSKKTRRLRRNAGCREWDDEVFYLDLSDFFALNSRLQCDIHGFSYEDLVVLFERLRPHMLTIFIGADRGVEEAVLRHQKHMQAHV